jgi:hypothetical protein
MKSDAKILNKGLTLTVLIDLLALTFIYFVPYISRASGIPVYLAEPTRIMLILAIVHTKWQNAYILALLMPLFSLLISGHPLLFKTLPMALELIFNAWLFYYLFGKMKKAFFAMLLSILISKILYYGLKYLVIKTGLLDMELISTPIYLQFITMTVFSTYTGLFYKKGN